MTVIKNHTISRVSDAASNIETHWDFAKITKINGREDKDTNRNFQLQGINVKTNKKGRVYVVPGYNQADQCWRGPENVGDTGYVIHTPLFFPHTDYRLTQIEHHVQKANTGKLDVKSLYFSPPVTPDISITRDGLKLTWNIEADPNDVMTNTSVYYRTDTWFYLVVWEEGTDIPFQTQDKYSYLLNPSTKDSIGVNKLMRIGSFSGSEHEYSPGSTGPQTFTPDRAVAWRLLAVNVGPTGMSNVGGATHLDLDTTMYSYSTHVFSRPVAPIATYMAKSDDADVTNPYVRFKLDYTATNQYATTAQVFKFWHPIDNVLLQYQTGTEMSTAGSWSSVESSEYEVQNQNQNLLPNTIIDADSDHYPGEDEAIFYRVRVYHDIESNAAYNYPVGQPFRAGNPKKPSSVTVSTASEGGKTFVIATVSSSSECEPQHTIELYVGGELVESVTKDWVSGGTIAHQFETDITNADSYYVRTQATKNWSSIAGVKVSDYVYSTTINVPTVAPLQLQEDGTTLYVSETHPADDCDITEYSWSTKSYGWESSDSPSTIQRTARGTSSHVYIPSLEEGTTYYVRVRRYNSQTDTYGAYSAIVNTKTGSKPGTPTLIGNVTSVSGGTIAYEWAFDGATQTSADIYIAKDVARTDTFNVDDASQLSYDLSANPHSDISIERSYCQTITDSFTSDGSPTFELSGTPLESVPKITVEGVEQPDMLMNKYVTDGKTIMEFVLTTDIPASGSSVTFEYHDVNTRQTETVPSTDFTLANRTITFVNTELLALGDVLTVSYRGEDPNPAVYSIEGANTAYVYDVPENMDGYITAYVKVNSGGAISDSSNSLETLIATKPTCEVQAYGNLVAADNVYGGYQLTALPLQVQLGGTGTRWDIVIRCADGVSDVQPDRTREYAAGHVVQTLSTSDSSVVTLIDEPGKLVYGGHYNIYVTSADSVTGSSSDTVVFPFDVRWSTRALAPTATVDVLEDETCSVTVTRNPESPEDSNDRLTLWRKTADGAIVMADYAEFGKSYVDTVPTFGWSECAYIAQVTTPDGDTYWVEAPYSLDLYGCHIDYSDKQVLLPWNLKIDSDYKKSFEARTHRNGDRVGYWQAGYDHDASISGSLCKETEVDLMNALKDLGRHDGIAYARAIDGVAFPCNVDVTLKRNYDETLVDVKLSLTKIKDDGTWRVVSVVSSSSDD